MEDPEHRTLEYRQGPDPLDPGGAGLRDPSSGEGVAALCLALVCPLIVVGTVKLFSAGLLCAGLPLSLLVACFAVRLAWRGLYQGRLVRRAEGLDVLALLKRIAPSSGALDERWQR